MSSPVFNYKVTFSTYVDAGDTYQAILKALSIVRFDYNNVITDVWNRGIIANLTTDLPKYHMGNYYTDYEDSGD